MVDDLKAMSAAERRERRLKRILGNSEERMKKILSGPSGDEKRLPPMLEGGEFRSSFHYGREDDDRASNQENSTGSSFAISKNSAFPHEVFRTVKQMDKLLSLFFGIFVRMLMANGIMFNVLAPWTLIFFCSHFFSIARGVPNFVHDANNILQSWNCSTLGRMLRRGHAAFTFLHTFTSRLLIMLSGYFIVHSAFLLYKSKVSIITYT